MFGAVFSSIRSPHGETSNTKDEVCRVLYKFCLETFSFRTSELGDTGRRKWRREVGNCRKTCIKICPAQPSISSNTRVAIFKHFFLRELGFVRIFVELQSCYITRTLSNGTGFLSFDRVSRELRIFKVVYMDCVLSLTLRKIIKYSRQFVSVWVRS